MCIANSASINNSQCSQKEIIYYLTHTDSKYMDWKDSFHNDWTNQVNLKSSNGVEIEGLIPNNSKAIEEFANKYKFWLDDHPSGLISDVKIIKNNSHKFEIKFNFAGKVKSFIIKQESLSSSEWNDGLGGVELASQIIETPDDLRLFSEMQQNFYKFGVKQDPLTAGIHNHIGLEKILGEHVNSIHDPRIVDFGNDFKKVEQGLLDYFGTHPYRNSTSGRLKSQTYLEGKKQGIELSRAGAGGKYITMELRIFNGSKDPKYLAEAINFNNIFLSQYYAPNSGLKSWMKSQKIISAKMLFKKLAIKYKESKHNYPVANLLFGEKDNYLDVFGSDLGRAFNFLEQHIIKNIHNSHNKKTSFGELFKYLTYLKQNHNIHQDILLENLLPFIKKIKKIYKEKKQTFNLGEVSSSESFANMDPTIKKHILQTFLASNFKGASKDEIISIFDNNFYKAYKNYPFSSKELTFLYQFAQENTDTVDAANVIRLKFPDMNKHIMSMEKINNKYDREVYQYIYESVNTDLLNPQSREYLRGILNS
ncbi:MAG: hypothetical protein HON90_03495 [Halobacteriovoraceae bacterium]|jgi:hypothetical protein|nr:hypothetical protein [Halobacteriovoraceae bacterium]